jgi:hypothetical protein
VEQLDLKELFWDRLSKSALYRDSQSMDAIVQFAHEHNVPFALELAARSNFLKTPVGWLCNRLVIAARGQLARVLNGAILLTRMAQQRRPS